MYSNTSGDEGDFTLIKQEVTYVVLLLNTNERFLEMTFEVLERYQDMQRRKNAKFGCSIFVFPKRNYIFKSISNMQPPKVQQSIKKVHNFNFEFLPIDDNVISLELNDIIRDLFEKNDKKVYQLVAGYLYKINFIFGKINDYVYRGNISQKIVEFFVRNVWMSEIADDSEESGFDQIREWANREFALYEDNVDDAKEIEKQYRMDGKFREVNKKISESFLIDVPRDDTGAIVREEIAKMMQKKTTNYKQNSIGKRKTFFHIKNRIDIQNFSQKFMKSQQNSKKTSMKVEPLPAPGVKLSSQALDSYRKRQQLQLSLKHKPDFEIKEESFVHEDDKIQYIYDKPENSFDSHSDSDDFDPNAGMFSDPSEDPGSTDQNMYFKEYDLMVVLDRSNDLVTPFVTQSSYMGLIDDLLKVQMNHIFVKGTVLGVEPQDIESKMVTPLSRPLRQPEHDREFGTNSMYNSITPSTIPKQSYLNPAAFDFNLLTSLKDEMKRHGKPSFNKTADMKGELMRIQTDDIIAKVE